MVKASVMLNYLTTSKLLKYVSLNLKLRKKNLIQVTQQLKIRTLLHKKLSILINKKRSNYSNLLIIKQYQKNKKKNTIAV